MKTVEELFKKWIIAKKNSFISPEYAMSSAFAAGYAAGYAAAKAAAKAEAPQWQPIESAPKDGSRIIVYCANDLMPPAIVYWFDEHWRISANYVEGNGFARYNEPTYWCEIPQLLRVIIL